MATCDAALAEAARHGIEILRRSRWYESAPVPPSDQPWYVNAVVVVATALPPVALLRELHDLERRFGRQRRERNAARVLDLDLLAYGDLVRDGPDPPELPHPRLHERAFVLLPLAELLPFWRHPRSGRPIARLISALPPGQQIRLATDRRG